MLRSELQIKEDRERLATHNGYMGAGGKLALIARMFGDEILSQTSSYFEQTYLPDVYDIGDEMPTLDEEDTSHSLGFLFDGLKRGMHLEIKFLLDRRGIEVRFRDQVVYSEIHGELLGYAPSPEWEQKIDDLWDVAKSKERLVKKEKEEVKAEESRSRYKNLVEKLEQKWGKLG